MRKLSDLFLDSGKEAVRLFIEGYNHLYGINNASVDQDKAVEHIRYAAGEGLQEAQAFMFIMYYEGLLVQRDLNASAEWLAKYKNISYRQLRILKKRSSFYTKLCKYHNKCIDELSELGYNVEAFKKEERMNKPLALPCSDSCRKIPKPPISMLIDNYKTMSKKEIQELVWKILRTWDGSKEFAIRTDAFPVIDRRIEKMPTSRLGVIGKYNSIIDLGMNCVESSKILEAVYCFLSACKVLTNRSKAIFLMAKGEYLCKEYYSAMYSYVTGCVYDGIVPDRYLTYEIGRAFIDSFTLSPMYDNVLIEDYQKRIFKNDYVINSEHQDLFNVVVPHIISFFVKEFSRERSFNFHQMLNKLADTIALNDIPIKNIVFKIRGNRTDDIYNLMPYSELDDNPLIFVELSGLAIKMHRINTVFKDEKYDDAKNLIEDYRVKINDLFQRVPVGIITYFNFLSNYHNWMGIYYFAKGNNDGTRESFIKAYIFDWLSALNCINAANLECISETFKETSIPLRNYIKASQKEVAVFRIINIEEILSILISYMCMLGNYKGISNKAVWAYFNMIYNLLTIVCIEKGMSIPESVRSTRDYLEDYKDVMTCSERNWNIILESLSDIQNQIVPAQSLDDFIETNTKKLMLEMEK